MYRLKETLRDTWDYEFSYDAANHLLSWLLTAEYLGIGALRDMIKLVDNHFSEILNWFDSRMSNGMMEGINSVIQGVKSRARGYCDRRNLRTMCYQKILTVPMSRTSTSYPHGRSSPYERSEVRTVIF